MINDEFHYLFICQCREVVEIRNKFIPNYYINNPNEDSRTQAHMCATKANKLNKITYNRKQQK
jgi:hypothetical protein